MRWIPLLVVAVVATGCATSEPAASTSVSTSTTTTSPPTTDTVAATTLVFDEVTVSVTEGPAGPHLVDPEGHTLYLFTLDDRKSTCVAACAQRWPPLLGRPVAGPGVNPDLLGNAERDNGSIQVTYGGHPLYRFAEDDEPGDVGGQGFNDVWFLVGPDGEPVRE